MTALADHEIWFVAGSQDLRLHDLFGRGGDDVMKRLKRLQAGVVARA